MKLLIPLAILLFLLLGLGTTPMVAAIYATLAVIICGLLDPTDRLTAHKILRGAVASGRSLCAVLSACAASGIIVGVFSLAGLGMGLPTTAAYIVCATAIAPALINLGVPVFSAHLFLLFFASISAITPPVAVASYAAAGIAQENPVKVSWTAFKLGITGFILPFAFVLNGDYLHIAFDLTTLLTLVSALVVSISLAIQGYGESKLSLPMRLLFLVSATVAITPYRLPSLIAAGCFAIAYGREKFLKHEEAKPAAPEKAALKPA